MLRYPSKADGRGAYVPHIDGLRAIAVLSVLVFHAFPSEVYAGFIGVDIFFVISGYLISKHIFVEIRYGNFQLLAFLMRRVRRLFPALLTVFIFVILMGWAFLPADRFELIGKHTLASIFYVQNINLAFESGYFDLAAQQKPLLHIWSLSIEEQFYLVWPIFLIITARLAGLKGMLIGVVAFFVLSVFLFILADDLTNKFYFPYYRFWELVAGALFVFINLEHSKKMRLFFLSVVALLLLIFGFLLIEESSFPSLVVFLPIIGTGLLIIQSEHALVSKVLASKVMTFIGKISYPLYLWHWPVLAFAYILIGERPNDFVLCVLLIASCVLGWLTHRFIEVPLRYDIANATPVLISVMGGIAAISGTVLVNSGFEQRPANQIVERYQGDIGHDIFHQKVDETYVVCQNPSVQKQALYWKEHIRCHQSNVDSLDAIVLGDSHAEHLFWGLAQTSDKNLGYYINGGLPTTNNPGFSHIFDAVISDPGAEWVVYSAYWDMYRRVHLEKGLMQEDLRRSIVNSIRHLSDAGKKVLFVNGLPFFNFDPQKCKFGTQFGGAKCIQKIERYDEHLSFMGEIQADLEVINGAYYIDSFSFLCGDESCSMISENQRILFRDRNHLNLPGSKLVAEYIVPLLFIEGER